MSTNVISINENDPILFVIKMFDRARISGAPVVNDQGECICLLTKTDLLDEAFITKMMGQTSPNTLLVRDFMKPGVIVIIGEETTIEDAALLMVERRVHRLLVQNEFGEMTGVLSSYDIVRAVARRRAVEPSSTHRPTHSLDKKSKIRRLQEELHHRKF